MLDCRGAADQTHADEEDMRSRPCSEVAHTCVARPLALARPDAQSLVAAARRQCRDRGCAGSRHSDELELELGLVSLLELLPEPDVDPGLLPGPSASDSAACPSLLRPWPLALPRPLPRPLPLRGCRVRPAGRDWPEPAASAEPEPPATPGPCDAGAPSRSSRASLSSCASVWTLPGTGPCKGILALMTG